MRFPPLQLFFFRFIFIWKNHQKLVFKWLPECSKYYHVQKNKGLYNKRLNLSKRTQVAELKRGKNASDHVANSFFLGI